MSGTLCGALDLGSNTFRLMLASAGPDGREPDAARRIWQEIPRISEGLTPGEPFQGKALARAWKALEGFGEIIDREKPGRVLAGATMAFRLASDGPAFVAEAASRFGWRTEILSGAEEARLSAFGALNSLDPPPERSVVFDVGGRSTEFIVLHGRAITALESLPVGVVGLKEAFVQNDPPSPSELGAVEESVRTTLAGAPLPPEGEAFRLIGTAGTVTTLASMLLGLDGYRPELTHGAEICRAALERLYGEISRETAAQRALRPGLHPMRADVVT
ncbi:MAG: hypothetical protein LBR80_13385, partial [Deltaproteobacteria bacterium]|nr:hypothetical protein [Deltaproteobacteria bacterium]